MLRTNGFALFEGEGAAALAERAASKVERYSRKVLLLGDDGELVEVGSPALAGETRVALVYWLEGEGGLPLVHGSAEEVVDAGARPPPFFARGEFSILGEGERGRYGARDPLGTRGLWVVEGGPWSGSMGSDHRLLPGGDPVLVPAGGLYESGEVAVARPHQEGRGGLGPGRPSFEEAARELASLIDSSVAERVRGSGKVAVAFSGGLDSSLLAKVASRHADDVVLCSAYVPGSRDETQSRRASELLGLELESFALDEEEIARRSREAQLPPGNATVMDRALWCIYSAASEVAGREGARTILLGQLADELFGGYMKYALKAKGEGGGSAAEEMMRADVTACGAWGFVRDEAACSASCEVRFPYADVDVAALAWKLPTEYKIREGGERKAILRAAALELGLPEELAAAPKKAAQFSTGVARLLKAVDR